MMEFMDTEYIIRFAIMCGVVYILGIPFFYGLCKLVYGDMVKW